MTQLIPRLFYPSSTATRYPSFRRTFSTTTISHQNRPRLKPRLKTAAISRPILDPNNPYLPSTAILNHSSQGTTGLPSSSSEPTCTKSPILVPLAALDSKLSEKLINSPVQAAENQISDPLIAQQVRRDGETQLNQIVENWIRNELNVMGTIREETIQIFMKLLLHPSTLAPIAEQLQLQTAGRDQVLKSSGFIPKRLVSGSCLEDKELVQLLHYLIGTIYRSLLPRKNAETFRKFKKYVINLIRVGVKLDVIREILIKSSHLSGQVVIGCQKGFSKAEIRVAQLSIWGHRRSRKISKLVPEQLIHRTRLKSRKAEILKQRWLEEEYTLIHWKNRMAKITVFQENENEAERLRKLEHSHRVKKWRQEQKIKSDNKKLNSSSSSKKNTLVSKLFNFWPFNSSSIVNNDSEANITTKPAI